MRFAENNRISHRQLYRQMILEFLAPFILCMYWSREAEWDQCIDWHGNGLDPSGFLCDRS